MKHTRPEKEISIILPAYNESLEIGKCVLAVNAAVSLLSKSYEIIVSEDGSTDGTDRIVSEMAKDNHNIMLLHSPMRLGKGKAIKNALSNAKGAVIVFMDVDLATNLDCLLPLIVSARKHGGMAIGSRHIEGAHVHRRPTRTVFSLSYNLLVRLLFLDGVHDHQCGFKAVNRELAKTILCSSKSDGYFFDTEMIVRCKKLGFPVEEVAVNWSENKKKGNSKINLFSDAKRIGLDMIAFRLGSEK